MRHAILAFDATGAACSVAVRDAERLLAEQRRRMSEGHAEALMPMILETLAEAGIGFEQLASVAVGIGPGSFTGIRIALAAARGIGLAAGIPVAGVDGFSAVAAGLDAAARAGRSLLVAIDSRRTEIFGQYFGEAGARLGEPLVLEPRALLSRRPPGSLLAAGDAAGLLPDTDGVTIVASPSGPDAAAIAGLAAAGRNLMPPRPFYLRAADVTIPGPPLP